MVSNPMAKNITCLSGILLAPASARPRANKRSAHPSRATLCSSGLPCVPGTRIMSPNAVKITSGTWPSKAVVDAAHRQHAHRASRPMYQFDVRRQQIFQSETIDGMRVAAAHLHEAIMPSGSASRRISSRGLRNDPGLAKLIDEFHVSLIPVALLPLPSPPASSPSMVSMLQLI